MSEITRATVRGNLERRGQSQYEISYQPTIKGRHQHHIKVEHQHIRGSPFPVAVKSPIYSNPYYWWSGWTLGDYIQPERGGGGS